MMSAVRGRERTWDDDTFHESRARVAVDVPTDYAGRNVFHTVWRNDTPKGVLAMKVAISPEPIVKARVPRVPKVNPFDAVIVSFNDGGTRRIHLEAGDVLSTVVGNLRRAAKKIDRTAVIAYDVADAEARKTQTTFRFLLKAKVAPKGTAAVAKTVTIQPAAKPAAKGRR